MVVNQSKRLSGSFQSASQLAGYPEQQCSGGHFGKIRIGCLILTRGREIKETLTCLVALLLEKSHFNNNKFKNTQCLH